MCVVIWEAEMDICANCKHPIDEHGPGVLCEEDDLYYFPCKVYGCYCCESEIICLESQPNQLRPE
jgi:hypothetical protein